MFSCTRDDAGGGVFLQHANRSGKLLEFREHCCADFIRWRMIERQLNDTVAPLPPQRLAVKLLHAPALFSYIELIPAAYRALIASRRSLPFAVSKPFSAVNASPITVKFRIWR